MNSQNSWVVDVSLVLVSLGAIAWTVRAVLGRSRERRRSLQASVDGYNRHLLRVILGSPSEQTDQSGISSSHSKTGKPTLDSYDC